MMRQYICTQCKIVWYRDIDHPFHTIQFVIADSSRNKTLKLFMRLVWNNINNPRRRIATKQCSLRSLKHLDSLDITKRNRGCSPRHIGAIVECSNWRILAATNARTRNSSYCNARLRGPSHRITCFYTGHKIINILNWYCASILHILRSKRINSNGDREVVFLSLLRRHYYFLKG